MALVAIDSVSKTFAGQEQPALKNLSAEIQSGRMTGLVGPDGAGKTTLIRLITGLLQADSGGIQVAGFDTRREAQRIHAITGYMPQKFGLYEDLSVRENLDLYAELRELPRPRRAEKYDQLLDFTGLGPFQKRLAGKLSGGMKQKLGLACALVGEPQLLLLDEPSVGVDPISRRELWRMVHELLDQGMGVLWSTAYLDEAERCDTVILLNEGEKLHDGPARDMLAPVQNRSFELRGVEQRRRRRVLLDALNDTAVADGVIKGRNLRLLLREQRPPPDAGVWDAGDAHWQQVEPVFEDAFIDRLGGGPGGRSVLAEQIEPKAGDDSPVIEARQLTKRFGDFTAVRDNSFTIRRGEIFGLLGPNGAGKSTTFKMMCGLLRPTSGEAFVTGFNLKTAPSQARNRIGYMAQKFSLYEKLSVEQNLKFFSGLYGLSGRQQRRQMDTMLEIFDLGRYRAQSAGDLPLGFKQRLALACAVMHQPDVLFLDEPTSGVDPLTRREFWLHINGMVEKGVTVMVTTHFMEEAEYCDRIGLIYRGETIATDSPDALKNSARCDELPEPTLEDAFIAMIHRADAPDDERGVA